MALQNFISRRLPAISAAWLNMIDRQVTQILLGTGVASGSANAVVVALNGTLTEFVRVTGTEVSFIPTAVNTGAVTLNVAGSGVAALLAQDGTACTGGELFNPVTVRWTGTAWRIVAGGIPLANRRGPFETTAPTDYNYSRGDIRRFGGVGDDTTDSTAALQAAFDSVTPTGDAVRLGPGIYRINGTINSGPLDNKRTTLLGNGAVLKQYANSANTLNIRNSQVVINGVRFQTDSAVTLSNGSAAIDILDVTDVSITDCVFDNLRNRGIAIRADSSGDCNDVSIKGCHFNNCSGTAVSMTSEDAARFVRRITIAGNTFSAPTTPVNNQTRAIHLVANVTDVAITGNVCNGTAAVDYSTGWRDCFMIGNSSATEQPTRVMVIGNEITGMGDDGVGISGATYVTISGNVIYNSLVTSGVYVPGAGTWFNNYVVVSNNVIHTCELAGIFLKDTKTYTVTGNSITLCQDGIYVNDNGVGILRGTISGNVIHDVERRGIYWDGGVCSCTDNMIDNFGDAGSGVESEKAAIFLSDTAAGSVISGNVITNGIHGFVVTGTGTQFIVSNNVVRSTNTGYGINFIAFTGGTFLMTNNILSATTGSFNGAPAVSATEVRNGNVPQLATLTFTQALASGAQITPAQITANQNDYNPTGWLTAFTVRLSSDASRNITGFARDGTNMIKIIRNVGAQNIVLVHQDAGSTANQRIVCPNSVNFTLNAGAGALLIYDGTADRWGIVAIP